MLYNHRHNSRTESPVQKTLIALLATLASAAFACKKEAKEGNEGHADMIGTMTGFKNRMCACTAGDQACAEKINEEMRTWNAEHAEMGGDHAADPEMAKKMDPIHKQLADCTVRATTRAGVGSGSGAGPGGMDHGSGHPHGSGSGMGSDHGSMDHGSGSGMGSDHGSMGHDSGRAHGSEHAGSATK